MKSEPIYLRALVIDAASLAKDHSDTALDLINLAGLYTQFG
jgi:hypothetical protein